MSATCIITLVVLVSVIIIGCTTSINLGLLGLIGAYVCGVLVAGMPAMAVINTWPIALMFQAMCILIFFSFATNNGSLELLANKIVYQFRKVPYLIPLVLFLTLALVAAMGAGAGTIFILAVPVCMVAKKVNMHPVLTALTMISGINSGAWFLTGSDGIMANAGFAPEDLAALGGALSWNYLKTGIAIFVLGYIVFRGWKCTALVVEKPAPFSALQKKTLVVTAIMVLVYVVPTLLSLASDNAVIDLIASKCNVAFIALIFTLIAVLMKIGTFDEAVKSVPWNTFIVVCGMGMLISVCVSVGLIDVLSGVISSNVSDAALPYVLTVIGGVMSLFTATMGVVLPTMYPIINALTATTVVPATLMVSALTLGSGYMGISPFSNMGAMTYNATPEEDKKKMFVSLFVAVAFSLVVILLMIALKIVAA